MPRPNKRPSNWRRSYTRMQRQELGMDGFGNPLDYADDPAELGVQRELSRLGVRNSSRPTSCPSCNGELFESGGMVGETVLVCDKDGIVWEDSEDAIRRVI